MQKTAKRCIKGENFSNNLYLHLNTHLYHYVSHPHGEEGKGKAFEQALRSCNHPCGKGESNEGKDGV